MLKTPLLNVISTPMALIVEIIRKKDISVFEKTLNVILLKMLNQRAKSLNQRQIKIDFLLFQNSEVHNRLRLYSH